MMIFVKLVYITTPSPERPKREPPQPVKGIEATDILSLLLKDGKYKRAFRYMFEMGHPIPLKIVPKLLNALMGV